MHFRLCLLCSIFSLASPIGVLDNACPSEFRNVTRVRRSMLNLVKNLIRGQTTPTPLLNPTRPSIEKKAKTGERYSFPGLEDMSVDREYNMLLKLKKHKVESYTNMLNVAGLFLRIHKYADIDWRDTKLNRNKFKSIMLSRYRDGKVHVEKMHYLHFPKPPLYELDEGVRNACVRGLYSCLKKVSRDAIANSRVTRAWKHKFKRKDSFKRYMDGLSHNDQQYLFKDFPSFYDQFVYRTTASYYLCWFTIQQMEELRKFHTPCGLPGVFPDDRSRDRKPFDCALYSFCPDFCYDNPCKGTGDGSCRMDAIYNRDFSALAWSDFNYTCDCESIGVGLRWSTPGKACIDHSDINECTEGLHTCSPEEDCRNSLGSFECFCKPDYYRRADNKCELDIEKEAKDPIFEDRDALIWARSKVDERLYERNAAFERHRRRMAAIVIVVNFVFLYSFSLLHMYSTHPGLDF
ncbi:hypothetical protein CAPTEDRAFT_188139 [Capitella teleta]|uniref:EGF-like domain-containing protein n=1 Tax=Capitella teleta TaxID=283909 RepID=R7V8H0_CAPTE|nr:hypothetical protein CAPTEDRAFT_188139 [Capitella teleta]|eukprot:ELU12055.1 hypothetical protein CAPTEDRAFT_188139 [Capitella teleta]